MSKVENQMTKKCRRPKHERSFVIWHSSFFRHSSIDIFRRAGSGEGGRKAIRQKNGGQKNERKEYAGKEDFSTDDFDPR